MYSDDFEGSELSFLGLTAKCDNFSLTIDSSNPLKPDAEILTRWCLSPPPDSPVLGLLRPSIVHQLEIENERLRSYGHLENWHFTTRDNILPGVPHDVRPTVSFHPHINTSSKRTAVMKELCERWRDSGLFEDVIGPKKWRAELYPIYADPFAAHDDVNPKEEERKNFIFEMERSACALFGVVTYGVHMTIYEGNTRDDMRIWVPTRAKTKQTWPGYLDNSVAGGIPSGLGMFDSLVKECMEEASITEDVVRGHAKAVGSVSYFFRTAQDWLQPEIEYVYDLQVPPRSDSSRFHPKPLDGEVECFELLPLNGVIQRMRAGKFKPNCAVVLIDFFIRHGFVTPDNEPDFMQIMTRLHGRFDYDRW